MNYLKNAFYDILRKKGRSFLTIMGIAIGVMSVIIISTIGEVGQGMINRELSSMGIGGLLVNTSSTPTQTVMGQKELNTVKEQEQVVTAAPLMTNYSEIRMKKQDSRCLVWGVDQDTSRIISLELLYGRNVTAADVTGLANVCLVEENYALQQYHRSNIVGKTLEISFDGHYETFTIIGVVKSGGNLLQGLMGEVVPCFAYIPYSTMQQFSLQKGFQQIIMKVKKETNVDTLQIGLLAELKASLGVEDGIKIENLNHQMDSLNQILNIVTGILTVIAGISLIVAGLSIMTVMLVSVSERTKEIGIKKSIGASRGIILLEFLTESFLITLFGTVIGLLLGLIISVVSCSLFGLSVIINWNLLLFCVLFSIETGVLFGVYPAWQASRLKPVEALRYE